MESNKEEMLNNYYNQLFIYVSYENLPNETCQHKDFRVNEKKKIRKNHRSLSPHRIFIVRDKLFEGATNKVEDKRQKFHISVHCRF